MAGNVPNQLFSLIKILMYVNLLVKKKGKEKKKLQTQYSKAKLFVSQNVWVGWPTLNVFAIMWYLQCDLKAINKV